MRFVNLGFNISKKHTNYEIKNFSYSNYYGSLFQDKRKLAKHFKTIG